MSIDYTKICNKDIAAVPKSGIRRFFDVASTIPDVISLGVGEPDFMTPYHIRYEAINSLMEGSTHYTSNAGMPQLRQEIAYYLNSRYNVSYDPEDEMVVTVGASEAIDLALRAITSPGDEVIIPEPSYVSYSPNVIFAGGKPKPIVTDAEHGFQITAEAVEKAITAKTKAIILPYPNNPTGAVLSKETLENVAELIIKHNIIAISDEIYCELVYSGERNTSVASYPGMWERTISINGFSKAFAMTGWRVGFACGPAEIIENMLKIHQYTIMCAPTPSQIAAVEALRSGREDDYEDIKKMRASYNNRRRLMVSELEKIGLTCYEPRGAFYVFPSVKSTGMSSEEFCTKLLQKKKVACVPGNAFGASGEGYIRCCYATAYDKIVEALKRIKEFIQEET